MSCYFFLFFLLLFHPSLQPLPVPQEREENGRRKAGCALPLPPPLLRFRERPKRREAIELLVRVRFFGSVLVDVVLVIKFRSRRSLRVRCLLVENSPLARRAGLCGGLGSIIHSSESSAAVATTSHCCLLSPFFLQVVKKMKS